MKTSPAVDAYEARSCWRRVVGEEENGMRTTCSYFGCRGPGYGAVRRRHQHPDANMEKMVPPNAVIFEGQTKKL